MKRVYVITCLVIFIFNVSYSQIPTKDFQRPESEITLPKFKIGKLLAKFNFGKLFSKTDNSCVYGFIGINYQRIRIKFITVIKNTDSSEIYNVYGKSMVKNIIDSFNGEIKIYSIHELKISQHGCENDSKFRGMKGEYSLFGKYKFVGNGNKNNSGIFSGIFRADFYIDKHGNVIYDDIEDCSDGYTNNQFVGQWISNKTKIAKICNWGDYRMPNSGNFDIGAGEFSPNTNDPRLGWQTVQDMWLNDKKGNLSAKAKAAKQIEESKWWE